MWLSDLSTNLKDRSEWRVLLVDNDEDDFILIADMLSDVQKGKFSLKWASTVQAGKDALNVDTFDAVLINDGIGAHSVVELIGEADSHQCPAAILLLSSRGHPHADIEALQAGVADFLFKEELNPGLLERSIRYAIERRLMQSELERNLQDRLDILESIQDGLFAIDREWRIKYINSRAAQNTDYTAEELLGKNLLETFPKIRNTLIEENYRKVMNDRLPVQFEIQGVYQKQWYSISVYPTAGGISIYWQDITQRKQAEEARRLSESLFNRAFNAYPNALVISRLKDGLISRYQ